MTLRVGVIPSNGRDCVVGAVESMLPQADRVVVVEAGAHETRIPRDYPERVTVLTDPAGDKHISRWWNIGIDWAAKVAAEEGADQWDVAVINDDVVLPETWYCYVADDMRALGCVAACSGGRNTHPIIYRHAGPIDLLTRLQGFAFVLAGESGLRADEELKWWFGDDLLHMQAALAGGVVMFPECHVTHLFPNGWTTMEDQPQIAEDRMNFIRKMGFAPW